MARTWEWWVRAGLCRAKKAKYTQYEMKTCIKIQSTTYFLVVITGIFGIQHFRWSAK